MTVKFSNDRSLQINGTLVADGAVSLPITFTSHNATPAPGDWGYILFSDDSGDAIYDIDGNYLGGSILEHCVVEYGGGVSVANNGTVRMDNAHPFINHTTIQNNSASGIYAWNTSGTIKITNSMISSNTTASKGGGITVIGGDYYWHSPHGIIVISNTSISNNESYGEGGGAFIAAETITVDHSVIDNNIAFVADAGAIFVCGNDINISDNTINNNEAYWEQIPYRTFNGGGIYVDAAGPNPYYHWSGNATISNNNISNNIAGMSGGGIYVAGGNVDILKNIITHNEDLDKPYQSVGCGGGIRVSNGTVSVSENIIAYNNSQGHGGGVYVLMGEVEINHNAISDNTANTAMKFGGGVSITGGTVSLQHNTISNNSAPNASAVQYFSSDGQDISNNTITGNKATGTAPTYTVFINNNSHPLFNYNNIFGNTVTYELWNDNVHLSANVDALNNWWGTSSVSEIQNKIFDWFDDSSKGLVNFFPHLTSISEDVPISPPTGLTATASADHIDLSWNANPEGDVAGYIVYWGTSSGFPYAYSADIGTATNYTITDLSENIYYVSVTAYDSLYDSDADLPSTIVNDNQTSGNESWYSPERIAYNGSDLDQDGDVDGADLAAFAGQLADGTNTIGLAEFAANFGMTP